jgi:hypothetical protein
VALVNLNDEDLAQIKIMLEAQADVGAKLHGVVANTLFKAYAQSNDHAERLLLGLEIFCKLMQVLEDVGLHCITWLDAEKTGDPLATQLNMATSRIVRFYERCAAGLPDQEIMTITCLPSVEELLSSKSIDSAHAKDHQTKLLLACETHRLILKGVAALYTQKPDGQIGDLKYGDIVNMYFNVKHGVKILWRNRPLNRLYFDHRKLPPTTVPILVGPRQTPDDSSARRGLHFAGLDFTEPFVRRMNENCYYVSNTLSRMAEARLEWLEGKSPLIQASTQEILSLLHEALGRSGIPEGEKEAIRTRWPLN